MVGVTLPLRGDTNGLPPELVSIEFASLMMMRYCRWSTRCRSHLADLIPFHSGTTTTRTQHRRGFTLMFNNPNCCWLLLLCNTIACLNILDSSLLVPWVPALVFLCIQSLDLPRRGSFGPYFGLAALAVQALSEGYHPPHRPKRQSARAPLLGEGLPDCDAHRSWRRINSST